MYLKEKREAGLKGPNQVNKTELMWRLPDRADSDKFGQATLDSFEFRISKGFNFNNRPTGFKTFVTRLLIFKQSVCVYSPARD